jgi:hypothetical protein
LLHISDGSSYCIRWRRAAPHQTKCIWQPLNNDIWGRLCHLLIYIHFLRRRSLNPRVFFSIRTHKAIACVWEQWM